MDPSSISYRYDPTKERYVEKVAAAGSWAAYEKAHRKRLTAIFVPKFPLLPEDAISHIVGLWAHTGYY